MDNLDAQKNSEHVWFFTRYSPESAPVCCIVFQSVWVFAFTAQWHILRKKNGQIIVEN